MEHLKDFIRNRNAENDRISISICEEITYNVDRKRNTMKRLLIIFCILAIFLSACSSGKTVKTREECKAMAEEFYKDLYDADQFTMTSSYDGTMTNVFSKDSDRYYVNNIDPEYGYDYYLFMEDGVKYLLSDDRTLFKDESMYDMTAETLDLTLRMNVMGYFDVEEEDLGFEATQKGDSQLITITKGKMDDGNDLTITTTGTKRDGRVSSILTEINYGDETHKMEYGFEYDQHIELPEYTIPKSYDNLPHVESPYHTIKELYELSGEDKNALTTVLDDCFLMIVRRDGRWYQFSATVSQELMDQVNALDYMDENYEEKYNALFADLEIEDCIDFTDEVISKEEWNLYAGKTLGDLVNDGFSITGYSFWEQSNYVYADKDEMTYRIEVDPTEGFDTEAEFEYEDLYDFTVKAGEFDSPEYSILPMH